MPERIVVHVNKNSNTFNVIKERLGKNPITIYESETDSGKEVKLPYKNMKKMISSMTQEFKDMGKNVSNSSTIEEILRNTFQLYRFGDMNHPLLKHVFDVIPAPGMFDQTYESWKNLDSTSKQSILKDLDTYFKEIDEYFKQDNKPFIENIQYNTTQSEPQTTDRDILKKAVALASAGVISVALLKKLFYLYIQKKRTNKKTHTNKTTHTNRTTHTNEENQDCLKNIKRVDLS